MKKKRLIIVLLILIIIAILAAVFIKKPTEPITPEVDLPEAGESEEYKSPIDFETLQGKNPDICAWLDIPGTEISYPVVQSPDDDGFYLYRNEYGKKDANGSLFTEHLYNSNDFSDPVTIIYGHHKKSGEMFGNLQQIYTDDFENHKDVIIYKVDEELHYEVFAAVPYSSSHILYYYDCFRVYEAVEEFIEEIKGTRAIGATVKKDIEVREEDRLLVLSTCLQGNNKRRFLVIAKLTKD